MVSKLFYNKLLVIALRTLISNDPYFNFNRHTNMNHANPCQLSLCCNKVAFNCIIYSLCPTLFVLFEKSNFLREHHLLSYLPFKNV